MYSEWATLDGKHDEKLEFKLDQPSHNGIADVCNSSSFLVICLWQCCLIFLALAFLSIFQAFLPILMVILYVLVMVLFDAKVHAPLPLPPFILPHLIDSHPLLSFCGQINPLMSLQTINSLSLPLDELIVYTCAAQDTLNQMNVFLLQQNTSLGTSKCKSCDLLSEPLKDFKQMAWIWDTGASKRLTPFIHDFICYQKYDIPVKDVSKINHVIGIGTIKLT